MNIDQYIALVIRSGTYRKRWWVISAFATVRESDAQRAEVYPGKVIREPHGFYTYTLENEKVQLQTTAKPDQALLRKSDIVTVTPDVLPSLSKPEQTKLGILLVNLICLYEAFGARFPYQNQAMSPKSLEKVIALKLKDAPEPGQAKDPKYYYVDELIKFGQGVELLESLADVFVQSVTRAGILPPPGRFEFRNELLKRYAGKLNDPVEMAKFESEMDAFDREYLKANDSSYGKFMSGKAKAARNKSFMTQGGETNSFSGEMGVTPIVQSLSEGVPMDQDGFVAMSNTIRYGSFSRGTETMNGGVIAKGIQRAADNWTITDEFCNTTFTKKVEITPERVDFLVGRWVRKAGQRIKVETVEQAKEYVGTSVQIYSSQYCKSSGLHTCTVCSGDVLSAFPEGIQIPLMNVSSGILTDSLKKMHNTTLKSVKLDLSRLVS